MNTPRGPVLDAALLRQLLGEIDTELGKGDPIRIVVCGGAAMLFKYDERGTNDIDVISEALPTDLRQAAATVGERNGLGENWFNDAAKIAVPRLTPVLREVFSGSRLEVYEPGPRFLLAMKLAAHRERDLSDAAMLIEELGLEDVDEVLDLMEEAWGHTRQSVAVEYFAREAFQVARGEAPSAGAE